MQLHEQMEERAKQTSLLDTQVQHELTAPVQVQASRNTMTEPQSLMHLLATAEQEHALRRKWAPVPLLWLIVQVGVLVAAPHSPLASLSYGFSIFLATFIGTMFAIRYHRTTAALAAVDDVRMVGPLLDRLRSGSKSHHTRRIVTQALRSLLPRLKASDAGRLTAGQKAALVNYLGRLAMLHRDKEFQVVILRALEQVGDAQAIPVVERIIQRKPRWSAQEQVHAAAVECLPFLIQRAQEEDARNTLLRSASGLGGETSQLLHPAAGAPTIDSHLLLRADPQPQIAENPSLQKDTTSL